MIPIKNKIHLFNEYSANSLWNKVCDNINHSIRRKLYISFDQLYNIIRDQLRDSIYNDLIEDHLNVTEGTE